MTHDDALRYALAGGLQPAEAATHLRDCPRCRTELTSLKALEDALAHASPLCSLPSTMEDRVLSRMRRPRRNGWSRSSAAAALFLTCALWMAWLASGHRPTSPELPPAAESTSVLLGLSPETDTTIGLLDASEPVVTASLDQVSPDAVQSILFPSEDGGSNG